MRLMRLMRHVRKGLTVEGQPVLPILPDMWPVRPDIEDMQLALQAVASLANLEADVEI